jgi:hypothetical protein
VNSSATVSFRSPQDVEVAVGGAWFPGAMLGWRHDPAGGCAARVRLRDAGEEQDTWVDLAAVRLPERHLSLARPPAPSPAGAPAVARTGTPSGDVPGPVTVAMPAVGRPVASSGAVPGAGSGARPAWRAVRRHGGDVTAEQPSVGPAIPGRHRAPADSGRHRATTAELPVADRPAASDGGTGPGAGAGAEEEQELLTRPMRLGDLVPHRRGGRPAVRPVS